MLEMSLSAVAAALDLLDSANVTGHDVVDAIFKTGIETVETVPLEGEQGTTDVVRCLVPGKEGRLYGGSAPTLGLIGRLGGIGARPEQIGLVSDGDGAVTAIACALKLGQMRRRGDGLVGDVIIVTHVSPNAPTKPDTPVPLMGSPVEMAALTREEVRPAMDAILSIDTTRGNRIINHRGFAISPTVKCGWILRVSEDLLDIQQTVTGRLPVVLPISMQDITPYGNGVYHLNSILQPATMTEAPVVGVALTAEVAVPGPATGASQPADIEQAVRFAIEVAKAFGRRRCRFYDQSEWEILQQRYGAMTRLQDAGPRLV
jgi:hypothetical protein